MAKREELVVGLDIGTTKIACIVGEVTDERLDIIGVGTHPSTGLKKGVVVNIDATVQSIQRAVEEAEHMAGVEITLGLRRHRGRAHQVAQLARRRGR